jgi:ethanolamine ammonia-lyase large subunit
MLNYQSTSYHDAMAARRLFGLRPAPEFAAWLRARGLPAGGPEPLEGGPAARRMLEQLGPVLQQAEGIA